MSPERKKKIQQFFANIGASRIGQFVCISAAYMLIELLSLCLLQPSTVLPLIFGLLWSALQASFVLLFPRKTSRIVFGVTFYVHLLWSMTQAGYYHVFGKMMWLSTLLYAGEGAGFIGDVLISFPIHWWLLGIIAGTIGVFLVRYYPAIVRRPLPRLSALICSAVCILGLFLTPAVVFAENHEEIPSTTQSEMDEAYEEAYDTMLNAKAAYDVCGVYQLTFRDLLVNGIYPLTEEYTQELAEHRQEIDQYFKKRQSHKENEMTGIFKGKNVVFVLMESMDDWLIDETHTPTIWNMMHQGIQFTQFYTPGYGGARTLNSEFCMNTGLYLPTSGSYVFNFLENNFDQTIANQLTNAGYTAEVFHYNDPDFYSRGELEPAIGYRNYNDFYSLANKKALYNEELLFELPDMEKLFFRSGQTFNTVITRSAHMSYLYSEDLSEYALSVHPEYKGMFSSEEEDCARAKARLVDDFFQRLLQELSEHGMLENTVIVAMTDHYTYGYQNDADLLKHSGLQDGEQLLLEKTPCFIWSHNGPQMEVTKTMNTADLVPTVLNLMGISTDLNYLGQDIFDPAYIGYAIFPDGSWICEGVACVTDNDRQYKIIQNTSGKTPTEKNIQQMNEITDEFILISNLMHLCDYYAK